MKTGLCAIDLPIIFTPACEKVVSGQIWKHTPPLCACARIMTACVVARSKEAKRAGAGKNGRALFQVQDEIKKTRPLVCFSSNYALYADFSKSRVA